MPFRFRSAARTHAGCVRKINEDSLIARDDAALWVVADGMGGHAHGQWASQALVTQFAGLALSGDTNMRAQGIAIALEAGNRLIVEAASAAGLQIGTTAVLIHLNEAQLLCAWVGDSRCYRYRRGNLKQLTRDHTVVQDMVDRGLLQPSEMEKHPMSHVLSRAIGAEAQLRYDGFIDETLAGDRYLLCSDGLTKIVPDEQIATLLALPNINMAADRLLADTLSAGAPDNVSLVVVSVEESTAIVEHMR